MSAANRSRRIVRRPFRTIRVSLDDLRAIVADVKALFPPDAEVRLMRIGGVHHGYFSSVDEVAALPRLPPVLYDVTIQAIAVADRRPHGTVEYGVLLSRDEPDFDLETASEDAVWAHGALAVLGETLARFEVADPTAREPRGVGRAAVVVARLCRPLLIGALLGAIGATWYYHPGRAALVLAICGAVAAYLVDLIFALTTAPPPTESPTLEVVVRAGIDYVDLPRRTGSHGPQRALIRAATLVAAVGAILAVMAIFFPQPHPSPQPHRAAKASPRPTRPPSP